MTPTNYIAGKSLSASLGAAALSVLKSSIKCAVAVVKCTNARSGGHQEVRASIASFAGTLTCAVDADAPVVIGAGDVLALVVGLAGGRTVAGDAVVVGIEDSADTNGDYLLVVTVESTGPHTES